MCKFSPEAGGCWFSCPWDSSVPNNVFLSKLHHAMPPEFQSSTMGFLSAAGLSAAGINVSSKATEVKAHGGCRLVLRVGVPSGMSGLPSGGHTSRAMFPLVSPACTMQPFPILVRYCIVTSVDL